MSVHYTTAIWNLPNLSPTQKFVLLKLGDHANVEGVCWPSITHLCERTGLSDRAVQKTIRSLETMGW